MQNRWLLLLILGFISIVTVVFFWVAIRPLDLTPSEQHLGVQTLSEPTVTFVNPSKGALTPKLTIVEFSDFECTYCAAIQPALQAALRSYPEQIRLVWKDLPNTSAHPNSLTAAVAAHCAARQNKFWEYHDALFARQSYLSKDTYLQTADELSLDLERFTTCLDSQDTLPIVEKDREEGLALEILATPTLFIGSERIVGSIETEDFLKLIEQQLESL